jgi:hypothetical protein
MKSIAFILGTAAAAFCTTVDAESLRCNGDLAGIGDSKASVLYKCGQPFFVESYCRSSSSRLCTSGREHWPRSRTVTGSNEGVPSAVRRVLRFAPRGLAFDPPIGSDSPRLAPVEGEQCRARKRPRRLTARHQPGNEGLTAVFQSPSMPIYVTFLSLRVTILPHAFASVVCCRKACSGVSYAVLPRARVAAPLRRNTCL